MDFIQTINTLRQKGFRITSQRELLLEILFRFDDHFRLEEVYEAARGENIGINLATVYRNLDLFEENGVLTRITEGKETLYSLKTHASHFHLICRNCKTNIEADKEIIHNLKQELIERYGFYAELDHLAISGFCAHPECAQAIE